MAAMAQAVGVRAESCATAVPSRMRDVWLPIHARGVKQSLPQDSATHTESKFSRSASCASSTMLGCGCAPQ